MGTNLQQIKRYKSEPGLGNSALKGKGNMVGLNSAAVGATSNHRKILSELS